MTGVFESLNGLVSSGPYYVQLSRVRLLVKDIASGGVFDDVPFVGYTNDKQPKIAAVGATANMLIDRKLNPFSHPRIIVSDFEVAQDLLVHAFKHVSGSKFFRSAPIVVMHPVEDFAGGLTDVEKRILLELAMGAGAREAFVWEGDDLSDEELRAGVYRE